MSHLYDAARKTYLVVHHRGACGSESDPASTACWSRKTCSPAAYYHFYDFCISRDGTIYTSWDTSCMSIPFYKNSTGGAICGGNCNSAGMTSVMMQRCYGGSGCNSPCPLAGFTDPQLCGLAYLSLHIGNWGGVQNEYNHISHLKAGSAQPCGDCSSCGGCGTECCGTNLATGSTSSGWTSYGLEQINRALWMRYNLSIGCNCTGEICA